MMKVFSGCNLVQVQRKESCGEGRAGNRKGRNKSEVIETVTSIELLCRDVPKLTDYAVK